MDVKRATYIQKIAMNPHGIEMEDTSNNFFDMVLGVSNMRYFKSQQIALDHCNEEREVNFVLRHTCVVAMDADQGEKGVGGLEHMWLQEDVLEGVAEEFCATLATRTICLLEEDRLCASRRLGNRSHGRKVEGGSLSIEEGNACSGVPFYIHVGWLAGLYNRRGF